MRIVFWGTPAFAVPSLAHLLSLPNWQVLGVVTQPDRRRGRGQQTSPSPVKALALTHNLPIWQPERIKRDRPTLDTLKALQADVFVVVAYGQILSPEILAMPRLGCINSHGSLLPAYRGAAPIQWSLYHGDPVTGLTTMQMDVGMDTGPMLLRQEISVDLLADAFQVGEQLAALSGPLLKQTLVGLVRGEVVATPQEDALATTAPLLDKPDFQLDWTRSAIALHNQVRGFIPNCTTQFRGQFLKVKATVPFHPDCLDRLPEPYRAIAADSLQAVSGTVPPGTVIQVIKGQGPLIQTGAGGLLLRTVQLAGKREQSGWDFANGVRVTLEDCLA
jgi:methionyl-tRNA formyltransferase